MENIVRSTINYWVRVFGDGYFRDWLRFLRWVYNYVYTSDIYSRVVSTRLLSSEELQLGFIGRAGYEIKSKREGRTAQLWALLRLAELMNTGTTRPLGFGHIRVRGLG
jgi:CRISPR/Cas system endoribonuclease Cas6 (RAMP superfamily)